MTEIAELARYTKAVEYLELRRNWTPQLLQGRYLLVRWMGTSLIVGLNKYNKNYERINNSNK